MIPCKIPNSSYHNITNEKSIMKLLKSYLTTGLTLGLLQFASGQEEPKQPEEKSERQIKIEKLSLKFSNLPKAQRIAYYKGLAEAQRLFSKNRTFETLMAFYKIEKIFKNDPVALNILGAVHVEFRDFDYARKVFNKAVEIAGENPKILFNIAEIEFCSNNWQVCIEKFDVLIKKIDDPKSNLVHLMEFKRQLCYLALANESKGNPAKKEAYYNKAKEISSMFNYMIDSPFAYYSQASLAYYHEERLLASEWIICGKKIFGESITFTWDDTLIEFGYITSHYGLHFSK